MQQWELCQFINRYLEISLWDEFKTVFEFPCRDHIGCFIIIIIIIIDQNI